MAMNTQFMRSIALGYSPVARLSSVSANREIRERSPLRK
jgi:hypothetical protein